MSDCTFPLFRVKKKKSMRGAASERTPLSLCSTSDKCVRCTPSDSRCKDRGTSPTRQRGADPRTGFQVPDAVLQQRPTPQVVGGRSSSLLTSRAGGRHQYEEIQMEQDMEQDDSILEQDPALNWS